MNPYRTDTSRKPSTTTAVLTTELNVVFTAMVHRALRASTVHQRMAMSAPF